MAAAFLNRFLETLLFEVSVFGLAHVIARSLPTALAAWIQVVRARNLPPVEVRRRG